MKKNIIALAIISAALQGCNHDSLINGDVPGTLPPTDVLPPTDLIPPTDVLPPTTYIGSLLSSGVFVSGDVYCDGSQLENGTFSVKQGVSFSCTLGHLTLGDFTAPLPEVTESTISNDALHTAFELTELHGDNVTKVLKSIDVCGTESAICLKELDAFDIEDVFSKLDDQDAVDTYFSSKEEESTDEVGKAPSSHVDPTLVPAVDPKADNNLNADFVSADAESTYAYKPSVEGKVLTRSKLTDVNGKAISGISFFSANATGVTDEEGTFEYLWGDKIAFGIDTFEFGSITGNQIAYKLSDVTNNVVEKANIQSLLERYAVDHVSHYEISEEVQDTFSKYPNVINELINLNLPNGGLIEGTGFELPNEFIGQFSQGLTAVIDEQLRQTPQFMDSVRQPAVLSMGSGQYVTESLQQIFHNVTTFHVFNDNGSFYGATGYTRGMRALNISNRAFPVMMPRTDKNRELYYGDKQAWTRDGKPYIAQHPSISMPPIPLVSEDNATYGFPFVTAGEIGKGKVVFMGNGLYPSILSCPENYWANRALHIDSEKQQCTVSTFENQLHDDQGSMSLFFSNLFEWFNNGLPIAGMNAVTNIDQAYSAYHHSTMGKQYTFFVSPQYGFASVEKRASGEFDGLDASTTPILILQAYPPKLVQDGKTDQFVADLDNPNLSQDDITALIHYVNDGGNILFMDAIQTTNPEPIGRLADAVGVSLGGENVTPTNQAFCGSSHFCQAPVPNLHVKSEREMVVLERFEDNQGEPPFTVNQDGTVEWIKDESKIKFEIPTYEVAKLDAEGKPVLDASGVPVMETKFARIFVESAEEREAAIKELQSAFVGTELCTNDYEYEFNCIETRSGDGITVRGVYHRADFERYEVSKAVVGSMVKAANLGTNFTALYEHEIYYRTQGTQGARLSNSELNQAFDNLSVWMWNDNAYRFETDIQDELGFKQAVQFLNCYTDGNHQADTQQAQCPVDLKASLVANGMIHGDGELSGQLNPSYPLNYMEKPLTRIMLGRSFWDHKIVVDTTMYPGRTSGASSPSSVMIQTNGKEVTYSAGNNQSTGLWAPQLQEVTIKGGVAATITVMLADDLTGKPNHETSLKRPPRMQTSYDYNGSSLNFKAPYGGLIYIQPKGEEVGEVSFNIDGALKAAWWKEGQWINPVQSADAPIAEVDTGSFIYTTPIRNLESADLNKFATDMNRFAEAASDFYGRDEIKIDGLHRRFTYPELMAFRHRFVNDVQITIGSAHSGYPVMNSSFNADRTDIPTNPVNDWLLWHEVGHNLASAPFSAAGSIEVTNNLLALYMQELEGRNANPEMDRIKSDIKKAPKWLELNNEHAWSHGDAGLRLVMFGQLKIWAKSNFAIDDWYTRGASQSDVYGEDEGWNMFKLMHRKARGDTEGDAVANYCSAKYTGLTGGDLMMVCSSYVSNYDLSDFFVAWNVGETSMTNADGSKSYSGGISSKGLSAVEQLKLEKPKNSPLNVDSIY